MRYQTQRFYKTSLSKLFTRLWRQCNGGEDNIKYNKEKDDMNNKDINDDYGEDGKEDNDKGDMNDKDNLL